MNEDMFAEFIKSDPRTDGIKVFRSMPHRKNNQCYVEQKNYTHVRLLLGYGRIDWQKAVPIVNNASIESCPLFLGKYQHSIYATALTRILRPSSASCSFMTSSTNTVSE